MKRSVLSMCLLLALAAIAKAQTNFETTVSEKKRIMTGSETFTRSDEEIFANALLWAVDQGPRLKEEIIDCDFQKKRLAFLCHLQDGEEKDVFNLRFQIQVMQGRLVFLLKDVKLVGGLSFLSNFDKLQPEKKDKHQDIIRDFEKKANEKVGELFSFVSGNAPQITNWVNVTTGKLDEGMSKSEVLMVLGKPVTVQQSGENVQMMYNAFTYVFLKDDIVQSVIR